MALVLADRVRDTTTTTSTGTITLSGTAPTGFQNFSVIGNGNTTYYTIAGQGTTEWEVGIGTYTSSGTTLSRDTVLASSNGGSLVVFSAGTKDVFVTYPAERSVNLSSTALTSGRVPYATTSGLLVDSANLTFNGTKLTAAGLIDSALTSGRVPYATTSGELTDSANLTFNGTTLTANTIGAFTLGGTVSGGGNQINNVIIGTSTPLAGSFTTVSASGVITSTVATGTAPFTVASTTQVANLNSATAGTATNLAGGIASQIPYQTGAGATSFIANGTSGQVLTSNGTSTPSWQTPSGVTTGKSIAMAMIFGF